MSELPQSLLSVTKQFSERLIAVLPDHLIGLYLVGSAALGGYHEDKSDIDFVVVIKRNLTAGEISQLTALHQKLKASFPKKVIEGLYIPVDSLGCSENRTLTYYNGNLSHSFDGVNAVTWFTLKKHGVTIFGTPAESLPFDFPHPLLIEYVRENVNTYWVNWMQDAKRLLSKRAIAALTREGLQWGVLGLSRMYYTLRESDVVSKEAAGRYILAHLPNRHRAIVRVAVSLRQDIKYRPAIAPFARRKAMISFMADTIDACNHINST